MGVGGLDSAAGGIGEAATALVEGEGGGYRYVALSTPRVAFVLQLAPSVQVIHRIRAHAECPQDVLPCLAWRAALPSPAAPPAAPLTAPGAHDARGRHYAAAAAPPPPLPPSATALGAAGMGTAATASAAAVVSASAASAAAHATGQTAAGPVLAVAWGRQLRLWHLVSPPGGSSGSGGVGVGGGGGGQLHVPPCVLMPTIISNWTISMTKGRSNSWTSLAPPPRWAGNVWTKCSTSRNERRADVQPL